MRVKIDHGPTQHSYFLCFTWLRGVWERVAPGAAHTALRHLLKLARNSCRICALLN
jgi:hypothetical protein